MHVCNMLSFLHFHCHVQAFKVVTLPNIGVTHYIGVHHRVTYPQSFLGGSPLCARGNPVHQVLSRFFLLPTSARRPDQERWEVGPPRDRDSSPEIMYRGLHHKGEGTAAPKKTKSVSPNQDSDQPRKRPNKLCQWKYCSRCWERADHHKPVWSY